MKGNLTFLLGIIFVRIVLFVSIILKHKEPAVHKMSNKAEDYLFVISNNLQNDNQILSNKLVLIENDGSFQVLDSIINEAKLIFRYSNLHCHSCIDKQMDLLSKYSDSIDNDRIILFTYYQNLRDLFLFKRLNHIRFKTYNVKSLDIPCEELQSPYFFVLDKNLKINDSFLPSKKDTILTINYLSTIFSKFKGHCYEIQ